MLLLAHTGITLGTAILLQNALRLPSPATVREQVSLRRVGDYPADCATSVARGFSLPIDYRLILLGSMLPDLIDKSVGLLFSSSGRMLCHTLLFSLVITAAAVYLYRSHGKPWLLFLAFGTLMHLILDWMWLTPQVLLYPLYGWAFPVSTSHWLQRLLYALFTYPSVYIPEIIGAAILIAFGVTLIYRKKVYAFVTKGDW